jgi:methylenetetrahydrofolate reductase (NADPH)
MRPLSDILADTEHFARGVELVTTRGTMEEVKATVTRDFASELASAGAIDWVSITDNAGGNPQLSPLALGKPLLYAGKEVLIHLSCKDMNRNALESTAWAMASEGFNNILALSGDYPASGYSGGAKPVFDIDSVGLLKLLSDMNDGLGVSLPSSNGARSLQGTQFYPGAVVTPYKLHENELVPQLLKLRKKIETGARFIVSQIGFDARKASELIRYMGEQGLTDVPLIGNVFLMSARVAQFFRSGRIAGVVVSDELHETYQRHAGDRRWFVEFAARQAAIFKGLGYRGVYYGGIERMADLEEILAVERSFAPDDWRQFAEEIRYSRPGEFFYYYDEHDRPHGTRPGASLSYRFSRFIHDHAFSPDAPMFRFGKTVYQRSRDPAQGPRALRVLEQTSKSIMFGCRDCGDCSLPDIAFLCPESQCAKNQRNGPCGGTRDGKCEVGEFECIWARAYDRLKSEGREQELLAHAPVVQDQSLRGTSAWGNAFRGVDHQKLRPAARIDSHPTSDLTVKPERA